MGRKCSAVDFQYATATVSSLSSQRYVNKDTDNQAMQTEIESKTTDIMLLPLTLVNTSVSKAWS